jgi:hypothetical protein
MKVNLAILPVEITEDKLTENLENENISNSLDITSGHAAAVCYLTGNINDAKTEAIDKTLSRINRVKKGGHHSVFDHTRISLEIEGLPKALAMVLNNEHDYATSEKSARYTKMVLQPGEKVLYDKWLKIFKELIENKYASDASGLFNESKIEKLAQENSRYLTSVYTPTSMIYSTSYRQFNYLYHFMQNEIENKNTDKFYDGLKPAMKDFCKALEKIGIIDEFLQDGKGREFSLIRKAGYPLEKVFTGDTYSTTYKGSLAQFAQAQRHRTLDYSFNLLDNDEYYVPPILLATPHLVEEWRNDCEKQSSALPVGTMVQINETGVLRNFILKMCERKCSFSQLEINQQTDATLNEYVNSLKLQNHPVAEELGKWQNGSRCRAPKTSKFGLPTYSCQNPCGFKEGISGEREI